MIRPANDFALRRKAADHDIPIPAQRIAQNLRDFLSLTARQFAGGSRPAHFQRTLQLRQSVIGALALSGHAHLPARDETRK